MASSSPACRGPILAILFLGSTAQAEGPTTRDELPITEGLEITVIGELEIKRRRAEVIVELRELGYGKGERKEGKTVFHHPVAYHPSIVLHDDGIVSIKRGPVRFQPFLGGWSPESTQPRNKLWYLTCLPPLTLNCFRMGGQVISPRKLSPMKHQVATHIDPDVDHWRDALVQNATAHRLGVELPGQLEAIWLHGQPIDPHAPLLPAPGARQAAILDLWSNRACSVEGEAARQVIGDFIRHEIQHSAHPISAHELSKANESQRCPDATILDAPAPSG
jgi:hypothetical protein